MLDQPGPHILCKASARVPLGQSLQVPQQRLDTKYVQPAIVDDKPSLPYFHPLALGAHRFPPLLLSLRCFLILTIASLFSHFLD